MASYQKAKQIVRNYFDALEACEPEEVQGVLERFMSQGYNWKGVYPFREQQGTTAVAEKFWVPLKRSLSRMQRRQHMFIAGTNPYADEQWVMSMGDFMGLFDEDWLGIRHNRKMINLRYVEFSCVEGEKITKTALLVDLIGFMQQAGCYPLPPMTGSYYAYPGPRQHDGLLFEDAPEEEGRKTLELIDRMVDDLNSYNDEMFCPPECYERTWSKDMIWFGPCGIGASYTIPRYLEQHQWPFSKHLKDKVFNGHVARFAEGNFACFFGWPNLTNTPVRGFLGLPGGEVPADMQVVDVYNCRNGEIIENWIFIDIPYWLKQQGLDIFERTQQILNPK